MDEKNTGKKTPSKNRENGKGGMNEGSNTVPNIKPEEIELPPLDPPVPNRAWTEMKDSNGKMNVPFVSPFPESDNRGIFLGNDNS